VTLSPGSRLGPYEIVPPLGAGGMGEVYRAKDPRLGREVAVKVLPSSFSNDPDRLRRFEQEARAAGILPMGFVGSIADFRDQEAFRAIVRRSRRLGFMCASAIHPLQVPVLNEEFQPSEAEVERAQKMVAAYDKAYAEGLGAVQFEGAMIDVPVVNRAQSVLKRAAALKARQRA
jgi:hypothetical protein